MRFVTLAITPSRILSGLAALCAISCSSPEDDQAAHNPSEIVTEQIDTLVQSQMANLGVHGTSLAIIGNGNIRYANTYGLADVSEQTAVTKKTLFEAASLSKVAFAYFALREVDRGLIDLDTPLSRILQHPDIKDERADRITARMVLSHTTGLPNWRWENEDESLDIKHEPGAAFRYSGEAFEYLALVLATAHETDKAGLETVIRADLEDATGCDIGSWTYSPSVNRHLATGYVGSDPRPDWELDEPIVSASLFTTAHGYGCLLAAISTGKGLAGETHQQMVSSQITLSAGDDFRSDFGLDAWGLGLAIKPTKRGSAISHGGVNEGFTAWFTLLIEERVGYVFFTNSQEAPALNAAIEDELLTLALEIE